MAKRTTHYLGPLIDVGRDKLNDLEIRNCFVIQRKKDGEWGELHTNKKTLLSRTGNSITGTGLTSIDLRRLGDTILIGEVETLTEAALRRTHENGFVRMWLFDIILCQGHDLTQYSFRDRDEILRDIVWNLLPNSVQIRFPLVEQARSSFIRFYDNTLKDGDEGVVVKKLDSLYVPERSDGKTSAWYRAKPDRTADYVVMGPAKTSGGDLTAQLGIYRNGMLVPTIRVQLPGIRMLNGTLYGNVSGDIKPIVGMVVTLLGREILKSGALRHGQFLRYRFDKLAQHCI